MRSKAQMRAQVSFAHFVDDQKIQRLCQRTLTDTEQEAMNGAKLERSHGGARAALLFRSGGFRHARTGQKMMTKARRESWAHRTWRLELNPVRLPKISSGRAPRVSDEAKGTKVQLLTSSSAES
ncbi:hypothetical protein [Bradyrhizobium sp. 142]|uniref:hypothetical protein n=1 Tax=Bradyrhizobium sp. 142 TaxID=2782618 RepID=UPI001FFB8F78|nr:hypothetical protein [Bradyrhizobium sp. 142]MCK1730982.1 hypothetical protein [Bradyrhizobium sp. 142]